MDALIFGQGQRILFVGDSITDCGRRAEPTAPYGNGYVHLARAFLLARAPGRDLDVINRGTSGNTIRDLAARWDADVLDAHPDWVSVMIGVNDVWRQIAGRSAEAVPLHEYTMHYERLLARTITAGAIRLMLMEPFIVETDQHDPFRALLDEYRGAVERVATRYGALLVKSQAAFDEVLRAQPSSYWSHDRVHPNAPGHAVIARAWLAAVGY